MLFHLRLTRHITRLLGLISYLDRRVHYHRVDRYVQYTRPCQNNHTVQCKDIIMNDIGSRRCRYFERSYTWCTGNQKLRYLSRVNASLVDLAKSHNDLEVTVIIYLNASGSTPHYVRS